MANRPTRRKYAVPPDEYRSFIAGLELEVVYLESSTIKRHRVPDSGKKLHYVERSGRADYEPTSRGFRASLSHSFRILADEDAELTLPKPGRR